MNKMAFRLRSYVSRPNCIRGTFKPCRSSLIPELGIINLRDVSTPKHINTRQFHSSSHQQILSNIEGGIKSTGYRILDIIRTGSLSAPPDPLVRDVSRILTQETNNVVYPNFSELEPRHFLPAAEEVVKQMEANIAEFVHKISNEVEGDYIPELINGKPIEDFVLQHLDRIEFPIVYLHRILLWYMMLMNNDKRQMSIIYNSVKLTLSDASVVTNETFPFIMAALTSVESKRKTNLSNKEISSLEAKERALKQLLKEHLIFPDDDDEKIDYETLESVQDQLNQVSHDLSAALSPRRDTKPDPKYALPLLYKMLSLRDQEARAAGFSNYANFYLGFFMSAPSVEAVIQMQDLIASKALPLAQQHIEEWRKEDLQRAKQMEKYTLSGTELHLEEYTPAIWGSLTLHFDMNAVLSGMFDLTQKLFGIVIRQLEGDAKPPVWDSDVRVYQIFDEDSGEYMASLYLDPFKRQRSKAPGENVCLPLVMRAKISSFETTEDRITKPILCIACDVSPPDWENSPTFMSFGEASNLFHEFGHALHIMLSRTENGKVSGINGVEVDALEFPSQFLSHWLYNKEYLDTFAKHYRTGEVIPDEMFQELVAERSRRSPEMLLQRIYENTLELELHSTFDPRGSKSIFDLQKEMCEKYTPYNTSLLKKGDLSKFSLIFGTDPGEPAFRYRYLWAEVMSLDAYSAFEDVGFDNTEETKRLGRLFREIFFSKGGSASSSELFRKFRGRDPSIKSFMSWHSLD